MGAGTGSALNPGLAGGGVGAVVGAASPAAAAGRAGTPGPVMGMGGVPMAGGAAEERERVATAWMLTEDQDVFAVPGGPATDDGVLS
jgi:hypothetical protein